MRIFLVIITMFLIIASNSYSDTTTTKWIKIDSESEMDDSPQVLLVLYADNEITDWLKKKHKPMLAITCIENKTSVAIIPETSASPEVGLYEKYTVRIRLDKNKPIKQRWREANTSDALKAPNAISLARQINKSEKMLFEFNAFNSGSQIIEFDVRGLEPYLKELADTCNWKL